MQAAEHPSPDRLAAFGLGKLTPGEMVVVEKHIADCDSCCSTLRDVLDDTIVNLARAAACQDEAATIASGDATIDGAMAAPRAAFDNHPRYRLLGELGAGGMGLVYKAEHRMMERTVALKVINRRFTANKVALDRFRREVKAAAKLHHPNIVAAFDADQADDVHFLVMEYVPGISLGHLVKKQGPLPVHQACRFIVQAAQGLQHAHEQGMVHRDIKPHNLMITRTGQLKILDFGLARLGDELEGDARLTSLDAVVGTPDYLAPEQARNSRGVDIRADIYSLGCTLYFLLTGRPPHPEGSAIEKMLRHCEQDAVAVEQLRPEVSTALAEVVRKMMARLPEERYQTPRDAAAALTAFMRPPGAAPAPRPPVVAGTPPSAAPRPAVPARGPAKEKRSAAARPRGRDAGWPRAAALAAVVGGAAALVGLAAWALTRERTEATAGKVPPAPGPGAAAQVPAGPVPPQVLIVLPPQYLWYPDFAPVRAVLEDKGYAVKTASARAAPSTLAPGSPGEPVPIDVVLGGKVRAADYAALVFVGLGVQEYCDAKFPECQQVRRLIAEMQQADRPVAALCAGQLVLASAGAMRGKRVALNYKVHKAFPDHGANPDYSVRVAADGKLITGERPEDAPLFAATLLQKLGEKAP